MRVFLAIEIDEKLKDKISEVQKEFAKCDAPLKYVETENLHCTLKFFGEIDDNKLNDVIRTIENKIKDHEPFKISIKKTGVFPNERYVRVLWLGMEDVEPFSNLQKDLDEDFVKMGFKKERSYTPHLTIGRVKGVQNKELLVSIVKDIEDIDIGTMHVDRLVLKESDLTPVGPIYTDLKEIYL